jgi:hypothetical protein
MIDLQTTIAYTSLCLGFFLATAVWVVLLFRRTGYCLHCKKIHPKRPENMTAHEHVKFYCPGPR